MKVARVMTSNVECIAPDYNASGSGTADEVARCRIPSCL